MKKINVGFIGLGNVVSKYHIPAIQLYGNFEVVAGCDIDKEKGAVIVEEGGFFTTDLEEIIDREGIDIYVIATPPSSHFEMAERLLRAGKVVLLEKPATENREQFEKLLVIANKNQLHFAFHFAGSKDTLGFRDWLKKEDLRIEEFRVHLNDSHCDKNFKIDEVGKILGGAYLDLGVNAFSVLYALGVKNLRMVNRYQIFSPTLLGDIDFNAYCELIGERVSGTVTLNWSTGLNCKGLEVKCNDGKWYILNNSSQSVQASNGEYIVPPCAGNRLVNHYIGVYANLFDDISRNTCNREMAKEINDTFFQLYDLPNGPRYC